MDVSSAEWFSDLGMDYSYIPQCHLNSIDEGFNAHDIGTALGENFKESFSSESYSSYSTLTTKNTTTTMTIASSGGSSINETSHGTSFERPAKLLMTSSWNSSITENVSPKPSSSSSQILSFENLNSPLPSNPQKFCNKFEPALKSKDEAPSQINMQFSHAPDYEAKGCSQGTKRPCPTSRTPSHAQDHIMAERKRREKLSQQFIALSAIVPGLKKMDKASVLGDAIKHAKQLQERVKVLEERSKKRTVESVVFVKKSQLSADDDTSSCDENFDGCGPDESALPEIEARVSEKDVLIRIHCEKQKGVVVKILSEIEKLQLSVVNSSIFPFGASTLDITITSQMDDGFNMTVKDLARKLRVALLTFM